MTESRPRLLTGDLLEQFASRLNDLGVPAIAAAQPGLSSEVMESLVAPLGLSLPIEARTWWGWHDGVPASAGPAATQLARWQWLPLVEAVKKCKDMRALARAVEELPTEEIWGDGWLPLLEEKGAVVIDTAVADDAPCPVRIWWAEEPGAPPDLPSLGELVVLWIEAIDRGVWSYDRDEAEWIIDQAKIASWPEVWRGTV